LGDLGARSDDVSPTRRRDVEGGHEQQRPSQTGVGSILDLQRLAGNRAVAEAIARHPGRVASVGEAVAVTEYGPPDGVNQIRVRKPGGTFGFTVTSLGVFSPPLLRPGRAVKVDGGWTVRAEPARVPEPDFEVGLPLEGRYQLTPNRVLDVAPHWAGKVKEGEDEHVTDGTLAWQRTWLRVGEAIRDLAAEPGPPQPSEDAARQDLWARFVRRLPAFLRPEGAVPSEEAQLKRWGWDGDTPFRKLMKATEQRDTGAKGWHLFETEPVDVTDPKHEVTQLAQGRSQVPGPSSAALLDSVVPPK
jgi:hypothetical protein